MDRSQVEGFAHCVSQFSKGKKKIHSRGRECNWACLEKGYFGKFWLV